MVSHPKELEKNPGGNLDILIYSDKDTELPKKRFETLVSTEYANRIMKAKAVSDLPATSEDLEEFIDPAVKNMWGTVRAWFFS